MNRDWYRRSTWTADDAADFETRLSRARRRKRSQYLRSQACSLLETGDPVLIGAALRLMDRAVVEFPDDLMLASALYLRGQCLEELDRSTEAMDAYRAAIEAQQVQPNVRTDAWLELAWIIAKNQLRDHYEEAIGLLSQFRDASTFPVQRFKQHAARALIANELHDIGTAAAEAQLAIVAANESQSGFRYHQNLGLVGEEYSGDLRRLRQIADRRSDDV